MKVRTLIVDDETLGRERIKGLLSSRLEFEVIGECSNGQQAVEVIEKETPDLVFLDVQMPELDGFGVIEALDAAKMPAVIFVTAHDKFALKAFDVHAIDYLLKPFDRDRFDMSLNRALEKLKTPAANQSESRMQSMLADVKPPSKPLERLVIKSEGRVRLVKVDDIDWIEAADNYVHVHVGAESHMLRETMTALENRLPAGRFMRISRSTIVNVDRIKELQPMFHGEYVVILQTGAKVTLSRGYRDKLSQLLGKAD